MPRILLYIGLYCVAGFLHAQELPILHYRLDEASGTRAEDSGTGQVPLEVGSGMGWSVSGTGVGGGTSIGRVINGDAWLRGSKLPSEMNQLSAYLITGWYKLSFKGPSQAVIIDLTAIKGRGVQLRLSTKPGDTPEAERKASIVISSTGDQSARAANDVLIYGQWYEEYAKLNQWIFFAVGVNVPKQQVVFYRGTATQPVSKAETYSFQKNSNSDAFVLGDLNEISIGSSASHQNVIPMGMYMDDLRIYAFGDSFPVWVTVAQVEKIRLQGLEGDSGGR